MAQTLTALPIAVFAFALLLIHVLALGLFTVRVIGLRSKHIWVKVCAVGACGLGSFGHAILLLGHLQLLHRATFAITGISRRPGA
jgi:hypothetical protein